MSVNQEFQFMAMLEGHELEKELLSVVSIFICSWFFLRKPEEGDIYREIIFLLAKLGLG